MLQFEMTRAMLENSNFFYLLTCDLEGKYAYINDHYTRSFAYHDKSLIGQPHHVTMHADDAKIVMEIGMKCFAEPDKLFPATIRKHDGKGGYVYTQWEFKALHNADGHPEGVFCIGYDITKYVDESQQLNLAVTEIEKNKSLLKEIAFQQSHIIRAPLSNIMGLAAIVSKMDADDNVKNICKMILDSTRQLDEVIKSIVSSTQKASS